MSAKTKPDYKLKSEIMELGLDKLQRKVSVGLYHLAMNEKRIQQGQKPREYRFDLEHDKICDIQSFMLENQAKYWLEAEKINHASYGRFKRLQDRITLMTVTRDLLPKKLKVLFLTFNFSDETLANTSKETRRTYVRRFLKNDCKALDYIANIDFGSDAEYIDRKGNLRQGTKREHYHAVILCEWVNLEAWSYGFCLEERVRKGSGEALSKYVTKLTNHAIKESTQRNALIYCRGGGYEAD